MNLFTQGYLNQFNYGYENGYSQSVLQAQRANNPHLQNASDSEVFDYLQRTGQGPQQIGSQFSQVANGDTPNPETEAGVPPLLQNNPNAGQFSAEATHLEIARQQRADWNQRFRQFENIAFDNALDPERVAQLRTEAFDVGNSAVNNSLNRRDNRTETYLSRFGNRQTDRSASSNARQNAVEKAALTTQARNTTRNYIRDSELNRIAG